MTTTAAPIQQPLSAPEIKKGRKFRLIPKFEDDPKIIAFAQKPVGKIALLATFGLVLVTQGGIDKFRLVTLGFLAVIAFLPRFRRLLVFACTAVLTNYFWFENGILAQIGATERIHPSHLQLLAWVIVPFVLTCAALMWVIAKYRQGWLARRPLLTLLGLYAILVGVACYIPLHGLMRFATWSFLLVFVSYFWYLAYAVRDCATPAGDNILVQFGTLHAFWGGTSVPIPKGAGYWRRVEAKTPEDLAITMIKGVKLITWCFLLSIVTHGYSQLTQKLAIPSGSDSLQAFAGGRPIHPLMSWLSLMVEESAHLLTIAVWGHTVVAICRMAGFRALRNTYAPLASRTIAEYWNRYYYYYKELLVDLFFYPAFVHYFKRYKKLRIFFATFIAVWLGGTLYHFMLDTHNMAISGLRYTIIHYRYAEYHFLLALAIGLSQMRNRPPGGMWFRERLVAPFCVFMFFCISHVFELTGHSLGLCFHYFVYLFSGR